jgi:hypothetical protein
MLPCREQGSSAREQRAFRERQPEDPCRYHWAAKVGNGLRLPFILGREKVRFSLLTCPALPSLAVVNAQWAAHCLLPSPEHRSRSSMDSSKAHSLKVSPPSLSQRLRFYETAKLLR